jgi:RHH-type proline utilization regulon transcriptional repressor/proline dehydrogenase/delta 1-pyrroline-5-carboxylate dehydrogenase
MQELLPRLKRLALLAKEYDIGINIDAEEADRLELSLDLLEALMLDPALAGFDGLGFVVQAYQKRCPYVIDYLVDLARRSGRKMMVRLVKGAYWDAEIKRAQVDGMSGYSVFTRKVYTDVSYLACAQRLLSAADVIYPQFATHNAQTLASVYTRAQQMHVTDYEFQCLHGMGESLYDEVVGKDNLDQRCRIYAPVGSHRTLLAYLVRRLLENGANSSFVNRIVDESVAIDSLIADPLLLAAAPGGAPHPAIVLPAELYGAQRKNSSGIDFSNEIALREISAALSTLGSKKWEAQPLLATHLLAADTPQPVLNPADRRDQVGSVRETAAEEVEAALSAASAHAAAWQSVAPAERAAALLRAADLLEDHRLELISLAVREAGKSLPNAVAEVREAADFLRYYASQVTTAQQRPALGAVLCISPWNFPLAIFTGQISAALAAGNVVLAKPAEQTPLIAFRATQLLHQAGIPRAALQLLPGRGETVGARLTADPRVRGVIFTGSTEVAQIINRTLAGRSVAEQCELPLIAETGGQNAMIVDSSALAEQVVQDVLTSAFDSAGQRCSALRVLCLQDDIADHTLAMLKGALQEMRVGVPDRLATDIGPVIDQEACRNLGDYIEKMRPFARTFFQLPLSDDCRYGTFVAPTIIEIEKFSELEREVFGPVLHVLRYQRDALPQLVADINASGYGLTLGVHTRIDETIADIAACARVGNMYVNRNIIGAVVGVQPFGGEGKSGTGPKAGGPLYLKRLQQGAELDLPPAKANGDAGFNALSKWAKNHGHEQLAALAERYARYSPLGRTLMLPGPTGEINTLRFAARGNVLCAASDAVGLLNQLAATLATGNTALVLKEAADLIPRSLPAELRARIKVVERIDQQHDLALAICDIARNAGLVSALAARDGALVPVIDVKGCEEIALWRLVAERALCVNTTAAGGNASLMTLGEA